MEEIKNILLELKNTGACGIKISFEDEGALLNEMITMRYLTENAGLEMSIKIGGCEAKRDIVDCITLYCDSIVVPMIESKFSLKKFLESIKQYNYKGKKGFNLETINSYNNLDELETLFNDIDFVTFGRVDFANSLDKNRDFVDSNEMFNYITNVFKKVKLQNKMCYLGGAISTNSISLINNLINLNLLDRFETRYIIFDTKKIKNIEYLLYLANLFEVKWLSYISDYYNMFAKKDKKRIKMIDDRLKLNNFYQNN